MIDFHSHVLPGVDDGPRELDESLAMLRSSFLQGVHAVVSTSHYYANEEYPEEFLKRRNAAAKLLKNGMLYSSDVYPNIILGAEVLYFPGISDADEISLLRIKNSRGILIEPPMSPWSEDMLDDIQQFGQNFHLVPIIAHVDRYMSMLQDHSLINRALARNFTVQVNGSYFLNPKTQRTALDSLKAGKIQLIGSDCHNMSSRPPNLGDFCKLMKANHMQTEFRQLHHNATELLVNRSE